MKGIVFTEFLEMVENVFSPDMVDQIIEASDLPSGGAYSAIGTYDHGEMVQLVTHLSEETQTPVPGLLHTFGKHLFGRFHAMYPNFFEGIPSSFEFLKRIDGYIHVEVRKLYPDAELPKFDYETPTPEQLILIYQSSRPLGDFAEGLIAGCIAHFGEKIDLQKEDLSDDQRSSVRFTLTKQE